MKTAFVSLLVLAASGVAQANDLAALGEGTPEQRQRLAKLEKNADDPPALTLNDWMNGDAMTLEKLKGKIVVLDFWATWCGPCIASIPHNNEMAKKFADKVVIIGVCHPRGSEKMAAMVKDKGIKYPVAIDKDGKVADAYGVNGFPDYYLIDAEGKLRLADCANGNVEKAIEKLLDE